MLCFLTHFWETYEYEILWDQRGKNEQRWASSGSRYGCYCWTTLKSTYQKWCWSIKVKFARDPYSWRSLCIHLWCANLVLCTFMFLTHEILVYHLVLFVFPFTVTLAYRMRIIFACVALYCVCACTFCFVCVAETVNVWHLRYVIVVSETPVKSGKSVGLYVMLRQTIRSTLSALSSSYVSHDTKTEVLQCKDYAHQDVVKPYFADHVYVFHGKSPHVRRPISHRHVMSGMPPFTRLLHCKTCGIRNSSKDYNSSTRYTSNVEVRRVFRLRRQQHWRPTTTVTSTLSFAKAAVGPARLTSVRPRGVVTPSTWMSPWFGSRTRPGGEGSVGSIISADDEWLKLTYQRACALPRKLRLLSSRRHPRDVRLMASILHVSLFGELVPSLPMERMGARSRIYLEYDVGAGTFEVVGTSGSCVAIMDLHVNAMNPHSSTSTTQRADFDPRRMTAHVLTTTRRASRTPIRLIRWRRTWMERICWGTLTRRGCTDVWYCDSRRSWTKSMYLCFLCFFSFCLLRPMLLNHVYKNFRYFSFTSCYYNDFLHVELFVYT